MKNYDLPLEELPFDLTDELGEIAFAELLCPGVYQVGAKSPTKTDGAHPVQEYYIVTDEAQAISVQARVYGERSPQHPTLTLYPHEREKNGWMVIDYEVQRYLNKNGLPLPKWGDLHGVALFGTEKYPEYFGHYPAPLHTPCGNMLRYKALSNGVIWLETDRCEEMVAICYPVWTDDLSGFAVNLGVQVDYGEKSEIENLRGYLFFSRQASCIPIFELLPVHREWETMGLINQAALMNAIWKYYPQYAATYNFEEQHGDHDILGALRNKLDAPEKVLSSTKNLIRLTEGAGTIFCPFFRAE
jgi:hypothetical protein